MKSTLLDTVRKEQEEIQDDILITNTENDTDDTTSDTSSTPRNKNDELKKKIKTFLSDDTNSMIDANEEEIDEIIEKMKRMGITKDKGLELQKIKNMKKSLGIISK